MSQQGLETMESTTQKAHEWIARIAEALHMEKRDAYKSLRAVLITLRDRLPVDLAVHFGAQSCRCLELHGCGRNAQGHAQFSPGYAVIISGARFGSVKRRGQPHGKSFSKSSRSWSAIGGEA